MSKAFFHLAWVDVDTTTGQRDFTKAELGQAIEAFARVTRHADTQYVRLAVIDPFQTDIATFSRVTP